MDLSFLKWPLIIGAIVGIGWLFSSGGVDYMYRNFTAHEPGKDASRDEVDEAGLSRLGGYCLHLWQYEKSYAIFKESLTRFPQGKNVWYNEYRMVKCAEKMEKYKEAADLLRALMNVEASKLDDRVPENDNLRLRLEKLIEVHELEKR